ncbi:hypothetical protein LBMAG57_35400 [Verrucomicrobiota bacterium]|nr:hypothetical protein LBMAG57_35400 [Verrucomicrobiota bacterium]
MSTDLFAPATGSGTPLESERRVATGESSGLVGVGGASDSLFHMEPDWSKDWWGMPSFSMGDARPEYTVNVHFRNWDDVIAFSKATGLRLTQKSKSAWFPAKESNRGEFCYDGPKTDSAYPVCIPSKGRADCQLTGNALERMGVSHLFFVEEKEYEWYCSNLGKERVVKMPFSDLGQGSIPARNFIWDWAIANGHRRHWCVDDNIRGFYRLDNNMGRRVFGGGFFNAIESFVDRYRNVALAGPHHTGFVRSDRPRLSPVLWNSRVYSCILIDSSLPYRWRGRMNEDTDLSLRVLKDGHCTVLFRALQMDKHETTEAAAATPMKGGNTATVYADDKHRKQFAESLRANHPDCVQVVWKFNRWHHEVDYGRFARNAPMLRCDIAPTPTTDDFGMKLVRLSSGGGGAELVAKDSCDSPKSPNESIIMQ